MHLRTEIGEQWPAILAVEEHAIGRSNAEFLERLAREERRLHFGDGVFSRMDYKAIRACKRRAVEHGVHRYFLVMGTRFLNPEFLEHRKFFLILGACGDVNGSGGISEMLPFANHPKVARI